MTLRSVLMRQVMVPLLSMTGRWLLSSYAVRGNVLKPVVSVWKDRSHMVAVLVKWPP